jgi:ribosome-associated protein
MHTPTTNTSARGRSRKAAVTMPPTLATQILAALEDHKAIDPLRLNIAKSSSFTDDLVIATGTSRRHVASLAKAVMEAAPAELLSTEGQEASEWVVVDLGRVVVHIFTAEKRALYNLEKLWSFTF